ncbi:MAG: c-type cytochrome [Gammaproteobacteria bacterium]
MLSNLYSSIRMVFAAVVMVFSLTAYAGDVERGKVLADTCRGCHAVDSFTNVYPTYHVPRVAGQSEQYLVSALTLYRDGNRDHSTMTAQGSSLSDQDIQDIAAYWASLGELDATQAAKGEAPAAAAVCAACHGPAGISQIPMNPNLAGQHLDYLQQATRQYINGERRGPNAIAMQAQMNAVSAEDLKAILKFYATQDGLTAVPMN